MNITDFELLDETKQEEIIFERGQFLGTDIEKNIVFDFYKIDDFYVQLSYEDHKNETAIITTFEDPSDMFIFSRMAASSN